MDAPAWLKPDDRPGASEDPTINRVELVGYLGQDAEVRYTASEVMLTTLSLATHRWRHGDDGELLEITDWHRVVAWGDLAEAARGFRRGALVKVVGHLRTRSWEGPRGERHIRTEIVATELGQIRRGPRSRQEPLPLVAEHRLETR